NEYSGITYSIAFGFLFRSVSASVSQEDKETAKRTAPAPYIDFKNVFFMFFLLNLESQIHVKAYVPGSGHGNTLATLSITYSLLDLRIYTCFLDPFILIQDSQIHTGNTDRSLLNTHELESARRKVILQHRTAKLYKVCLVNPLCRISITEDRKS